ncbi:hypothetical protein B0187_09785 [Haemophilus paracuniculus]|uniref:Thiol disulfide oxidoreductase n=1 Tax=Haemophilus paracuniculus TaxID=734 RepID=A0A1T0AQ86_9PAST|nr:hypothetical protein [Haemophilus paracuniculus]OOR98081.1 hypothetical protein B0187_09785 [Haemophilus paracuniculus]
MLRKWLFFSFALLSLNLANGEPLPQFEDGSGYYSYIDPVKVELPKDGKILIQYFYTYGCDSCLTADDTLKAYAERNAHKVVLQRTPASSLQAGGLTTKLSATFAEYGKPELDALFLFDSVGQKEKNSLVKNNQALIQWLKQQNINVDQFHQLFNSTAVQNRVDEIIKINQLYRPKYSPMAVLNGKYILVKNTLYNDDYTNAVLDFLVRKIKTEQANQ